MASVQGVYIAIFGRPADPGGLAYWNGVTNNGADLSQMIAAFTDADEFRERYEGQTSAEIVTSIYQALFGREPDAEGLAFYSEALENGELPIESIAVSVLDGAQNEDQQRVQNKEAAADKFTASLDTPEEIAAYSGENAENYGEEFLNKVTDDPETVPTDEEVEQATDEVEALPPEGQAPGEGAPPEEEEPGSGGGGGSSGPNLPDAADLDNDGTLVIAENAYATISVDNNDRIVVTAPGYDTVRIALDSASGLDPNGANSITIDPASAQKLDGFLFASDKITVISSDGVTEFDPGIEAFNAAGVGDTVIIGDETHSGLNMDDGDTYVEDGADNPLNIIGYDVLDLTQVSEKSKTFSSDFESVTIEDAFIANYDSQLRLWEFNNENGFVTVENSEFYSRGGSSHLKDGGSLVTGNHFDVSAGLSITGGSNHTIENNVFDMTPGGYWGVQFFKNISDIQVTNNTFNGDKVAFDIETGVTAEELADHDISGNFLNGWLVNNRSDVVFEIDENTIHGVEYDSGLFGGADGGAIIGGNGNDFIQGGKENANDIIWGEDPEETDKNPANFGDDRLDGGLGDNILILGTEAQDIQLGGQDTVVAGGDSQGNDVIFNFNFGPTDRYDNISGPGNDVVEDSEGADLTFDIVEFQGYSSVADLADAVTIRYGEDNAAYETAAANAEFDDDGGSSATIAGQDFYTGNEVDSHFEIIIDFESGGSLTFANAHSIWGQGKFLDALDNPDASYLEGGPDETDIHTRLNELTYAGGDENPTTGLVTLTDAQEIALLTSIASEGNFTFIS